MASPAIPTLSAYGAEMPAIGFGTSSLGDCGEIVASALRLGYRHIDTAWKYGTERGVGEGIRASGLPRNEIFLTTKVSHEYLRADDFARSGGQSLKTLGVDFVDLLLVHWPNPQVPLSEPMPSSPRPNGKDLPAISGSRISISPCSTKRSGSVRSRWSTCRPNITPISTRPSSRRRAASAA